MKVKSSSYRGREVQWSSLYLHFIAMTVVEFFKIQPELVDMLQHLVSKKN